MVVDLVVFTILLPMAVTAVILFAVLRRLATQPSSGRLISGLALGLGYLAGNLSLSIKSADAINLRVCYVAVAALLLGALELYWRKRVRYLLRLVVCFAAAGWIAAPLIGPQGWTVLTTALWISAIAGASFVFWTALAAQAEVEPGPSLAFALLALGTVSAATVVMSALNASGQLLGALVASLSLVFLLVWRYPAVGRLSSAAPVVALVTVSHWSQGLLYGELPKSAFALLTVAPLVLLLARWAPLRRAKPRVAFVVRMVLLMLPLLGAAGLTALKYFDVRLGAPPASKATPADAPQQDDSYGYD
ncbi:MAG: hypothetical protein H6707_00540 [Deltaproteobacteria bacterium]|nr:hypothetical protein [Deltaproteobacteria bacterium]